jgi:hypothetical protein
MLFPIKGFVVPVQVTLGTSNYVLGIVLIVQL